jgi:two-component system chemotaxis response regulator CheY
MVTTGIFSSSDSYITLFNRFLKTVTWCTDNRTILHHDNVSVVQTESNPALMVNERIRELISTLCSYSLDTVTTSDAIVITSDSRGVSFAVQMIEQTGNSDKINRDGIAAIIDELECEGVKTTSNKNPNGSVTYTCWLDIFNIVDIGKTLESLSHVTGVPLSKIETLFDCQRHIIDLNGIECNDTDTAALVSVFDLLQDEISTRKREMKMIKSTNPASKKIRVLIVDDSIYVHSYLSDLFKGLGYDIAGFAMDGLQGFEQYISLKPDLVTLDNTMPGASGIELACRILENDPDATLLFITAVGDADGFRNQLTSKIPGKEFHIVTKPVNVEHLKSTLKNLESVPN